MIFHSRFHGERVQYHPYDYRSNCHRYSNHRCYPRLLVKVTLCRMIVTSCVILSNPHVIPQFLKRKSTNRICIVFQPILEQN